MHRGINVLGNSFALPYDLRVLVGGHIDQVGLAWTHLLDVATHAMSLWLGALPEHEATSRFKAVHEQAMGYGKQNIKAVLSFANELTKAENLQDVLTKQSHYAQMQLRNYDLQAQELGRLMTATA